MVLSINQPAFLPWLGYFHRIAISDLHIVLDHVQYEKNSYTNRNKIRTSEEALWLTVPVITSGHFGDLAINKIEISNQTRWKKKIIENIKQNYQKAPYFNRYFPFIEDAIQRDWKDLNELLKVTNEYFLKELDITTPIVYSSDIECSGTKGDLVLNLCKMYNAAEYISGPFGKGYLDIKKFKENGINVTFHEYNHPVYSQVYDGFVFHLSIVDLLFNHGKDSKDILMNK
jgi:hypothetical protein